MAANGLLRYGMSSVFPLFTVQSKLCPRLVFLKVLILTSFSVHENDDSLGDKLSRLCLSSYAANSLYLVQVRPKDQGKEQL